MNIQRTKLYLWCTTASLILATITVVATASLWPYDTPTAQNNVVPTHRNDTSKPVAVSLPALATFGKIWSLNLRRPLVDKPVSTQAAAKKSSKPARPLSARLAGTVVEPGHSIAMFITKNGKIELKKVGEKVGDAEILEITPIGASVRYHGKVIDLALEKEKKKKKRS